MAEGAMSCVKLLLVVFNFVFFIIGLALIVIGGVILANFTEYQEVQGLQTGPIFIMVVGAIILIIAFFGCCGAYKENHCMVMTFAVFVGIIFALEIIAAIVAFAFRDRSEGLLEDSFEKSIDKYLDGDDKGHKDAVKFWDLVQHEFKCCGIYNYTSWSTFGEAGKDVPDSCCMEETEGCGKGAYVNTTGIYTQGCLNEMEVWVKDRIIIIGGVALGLAFLELMGIIFACCLARSIKKNYEVV